MVVEFGHTSFSYNKETRTFVAEASDLNLHNFPEELLIVGKETAVRFYHIATDTDADGDVAGLRYRNEEVNCNVLIIND